METASSTRKLIICFDNDNNNDQETRLFLQLLADSQRLIHSSIGPLRSTCKFVSTKSDPNNTTLTNTSRFIFNPLYRLNSSDNTSSNGLTEWKFQTIRSSLESAHFSRFFDAGLFLMHILNELIIQNKQDSLDRELILSTLKCLIDKLNNDRQSIDSSSLFLAKLDLNSLDFLRNLLRTVLFSSKLLVTSFESNQNNADRFLNTFLKLNLNSFNNLPNDQSKFVFTRNVYLFDDDSNRTLNDSLIFTGLLVKQPKFYSDKDLNEFVEKNATRSLKSILFDTNSLGGDFENIADTGLKFEFDLSDNHASVDLNRRHFFTLDKITQQLDVLIDRYEINVILSQKV